ncbi:hypothetical protein RMCBS344292_06869 [Rhizopus microsporus]|nr:hypothetical protein RMCBS344292_06869 [Rhizopus microsporus]
MTGIQSALQHDQIINSDTHDAMIVEREANLVAQRAAAALKESRRLRRAMDIGTPTWTGRSGSAGAPRYVFQKRSETPPPRFGQSMNDDTMSDTSTSSFGSGIISGFKGSGNAKPSSRTLLARIKERKAAVKDDTTAEGSVPVTVLDDATREGMIVKLRDFLSEHEGRATSQEIMDNLTLNIKKEQVIIFRKMLQQIAKFEKNEQGKGVWVLKEEFY